jgi:hypothetical protein
MADEASLRQCRQPSGHDVGTLVARGQHLVDSRPRDAYPLAWYIEASHIGDLTAIAMVAASAAGRHRSREVA